ncbi:MAG TPA: hypothetical protein VFQ61_14710, partial [Polyangiaceae bacterium]|nr:hypothetical protein [Polyangiaceae bacterium]
RTLLSSADTSRALSLAVPAALLVVFLGIVQVRQRAQRQAYWSALREPSVEPLIRCIERSMAMAKRLPDVDAFSAQARAMAYAFYERHADAVTALESVDWLAKAPLVQAVGVSADSLVTLFCERDPDRAAELCRRALILADVSPLLPGAKQTRQYHATCLAVAEALRGAPSGDSIAALESGARERRYPPLQLLAHFGLAVSAEGQGELLRAGGHREFLKQRAPHAVALHRSREDYAVASPVSPHPDAALRAPSLRREMTRSDPRAASGKQSALRALRPLLLLWGALLVAFLLIWRLLSSS